MSAAQTNNFQLETLSTTALVFAHQNPFSQSILNLFQRHQCQASLTSHLNSKVEEPDYAVFVLDSSFQEAHLINFLAKFHQTRVFLIIPAAHFEYQPPTHSNLTTIYLGELYDCNFLDSLFAPHIFKFIQEAISHQTITIPGDGLFSIFPLHQQDALQGLIDIIFNPYLDNHQILLQSLHDISLLSLAHQINAITQSKLNLIFDSNLKPLYIEPPTTVTPIHKLHNFIETVSLKDNLECLLQLDLGGRGQFKSQPQPQPQQPQQPQSTLPSSIAEPKSKSRPRLKPLFPPSQPKTIDELKKEIEFVKLKPKSKPKPKLQILRRWLVWFSRAFKPIVLLFAVYALISGLLVATTFVSLKNISKSLYQLQSPSKLSLQVAKISFQYFHFNFHQLSHLPFVGRSSAIQQLDLLSELAINPGIYLLNQVGFILPKLIDLNQHLLAQKTIDLNSLLEQLSQSLDFIYSDVSFLSLKLPDKLDDHFPVKLRDFYDKKLPKLHQARQQLFVFKTIVPSLSSLLGVKGESKKYLVLLQNNTELRPTGGFIGSFAILEFEDGQLFNFQVFDVYQADGQLKGHVEPPEPIKKYLGEGGWYLRDSNWDPNFPVSAKRAEWFTRKTIKQEFDGVIALNLNYVQNLLKQLGPIELPDYQETITADNLFERAEYHSEVGFFPGSTQKKNFLSALANQLFNQLKTKNSKQDMISVLIATLESLNSHDILIYFNDDSLNTTFDFLGWTGRIQSPQCPLNLTPDNCLQDYLYLVDANLGINKANYFIRRAIKLDINISKQLLISHQLNISYTNTATSNEWPAGTYKNYQRLYLPYDAVLDSIFLNNSKLDSEHVDVEKRGGKTIIGYLIQVPINQTLTVKVNYHLETPLPNNNPLYSLYWQRQPGTNLDPLTISLHYPLYLHPQIISPKATLSPQLLQFNLVSSQDRRILVRFSQ